MAERGGPLRTINTKKYPSNSGREEGKQAENTMEKNLTSGSVLKSILFFFTALSAFALFADAVRHGGSVHHRAV